MSLFGRAVGMVAVTGMVYLVDAEGRIAAVDVVEYAGLSPEVLGRVSVCMTIETARARSAERRSRS